MERQDGFYWAMNHQDGPRVVELRTEPSWKGKIEQRAFGTDSTVTSGFETMGLEGPIEPPSKFEP